jgi:hypothetical protein
MSQNLDSLNNLFTDEDVCIQFLFDRSIFYQTQTCQKCLREMKLCIDRCSFRCFKPCSAEVSIKKNSFFDGHRLPCSKVLRLGWFWINRVPVTSIISMTGHSPNTVTNFMGYFRQLITSSIDLDDTIIGGDGVIVEVDESKVGKRKYHRGHRVEGAWIFGGIERTTEKKVFLVQVSDRSAGTLLGILSEHVLPGSIIYSDMWKGYIGIEDLLGMVHMTVNHSKTFKDNVTGVHTNTIEGLWNGVKTSIPPRNRNKSTIDCHLMEYVWRKKNKGRLWEAFLDALADTHYD